MRPSCAAALREYDDPGEAAAAYAAATTPALRERYNYLTALDAQRHRMWMGGPVDLAHRDGDYALFSMIAVGAAPTIDHVFRVFIRRIGFLASTAVLDSDLRVQRGIEDLYRQLLASLPPPGPPRTEMLAAAEAAASGA
jgi:hypothetical protein